MAVSGRHFLYRIFTLESEFRGPFGARMIMRHVSVCPAVLPEAVCPGPWVAPIEGMPLVLPRQVHGTEIITAADAPVLPERPDCDGVLLDARHPFGVSGDLAQYRRRGSEPVAEGVRISGSSRGVGLDRSWHLFTVLFPFRL